DRAVVAVLRAENLARGLLLVRREDFVLAVVLSDNVEHVREAVVVVVADVGTEKRLRDGARRIVLVEHGDERGEDALGEVGLRRVVNLVAGAVDDYARMVAVAAD